MIRRISWVLLVAALAAPVTLVPVASADPVFPVCAGVEPLPDVVPPGTSSAWLCLGGETGLYDPLAGPYCRPAVGGCYFTVTVGSTGAAHVDAQLCTVAAGQPPLCVNVDSGTISHVRVAPMNVCYGWSPWMPPCYHDAEEQ